MLKLYTNPISSYSTKVLVAFDENGAEYESAIVNLMDRDAKAEYVKNVNPLGKVPFLHDVENDWRVPESSIIVEYVEHKYPVKARMVPNDPDASRQVRFRDRLYDLYVAEPAWKIVLDAFRPEKDRDAYGVAEARARLDKAYALFDREMGRKGAPWASGEAFTLADCSAAAALRVASWVHPFTQHEHLAAYFARLCARPSVARVAKEAEPYEAAMTKH